MEYESVIGLEVHLQLAAKSKVFCSCSTEFGAEPNDQTCPVCLGFPGALPVLNRNALALSLRVALALNCKISEIIKFDRKNYFYPDLPKNFQISQYDQPIGLNGYLDIDEQKRVKIRRVHLEEDAGKLVHQQNNSLVDFNRAGMPLLEVVTEADIGSASEGHLYLTRLKEILEYLEVSDCNMEEGSLRCDANISVRIKGESKLGVKVEIKNMNSFKAVKSALNFEYQRQTKLLKEETNIIQETRLWDEGKLITISMRSKEEAFDYRYFPEPDLPPFTITESDIKKVHDSLPELPKERVNRLIEQHKLPRYDASILTSSKALADYFEECVGLYNNPKLISNWIIAEVLSQLNLRNISINELGLKASFFVSMLKMIDQGLISGKIAKNVLGVMIDTDRDPEEIVKTDGLIQISDSRELESVIEEVLNDNSKVVNDFLNGKNVALKFLVGQVMAKTKGRANPRMVNEILKSKLIEGGKDA